MPLNHGYGVVIGTIASHFIESPDSEGKWPHYHINVQTPEGVYQCVINLKSRTEVKIAYRDFRQVRRSHFQSIVQKPDGFHRLDSNDSSGALDVIRHPGLLDPYPPPRFPFWWWPERFGPWKPSPSNRCRCTQWWLESGTDVVQLMEYYLLNVSRIYIFGEPFDTGLGLHNIHMNQGDPINSNFAKENGIWQDGGTLLEYHGPQPRLSVFLTKFETQTLQTDDLGRPS